MYCRSTISSKSMSFHGAFWYILYLDIRRYHCCAVFCCGNKIPDSNDTGSITIKHRPDYFASDRCPIDIDPRVFAIWNSSQHFGVLCVNQIPRGYFTGTGAIIMIWFWKVWVQLIINRSQQNTTTCKRCAYIAVIPAWISKYIHYKVWDVITYPFLNFNGATVEV